ncbi:MAG: ABC transporter permease [Labedaea sp.]
MIRAIGARLTWDKLVPLLLVLTIVVGTRVEPRFGRGGNLAFVVQDIGEIMLIAFAMTLVIMTGEIDLSVASTAALASCVLGWAFAHGVPIWFAVLLALVTGLVCGAVNGLLITSLGLPSLAVTIGTLALFRGLCWALLGDEPVASYPESWTRLGSGRFPHTYIPYLAPLLLVCAIAFTVLLHATRSGRWIVAIGQSAEAAMFAGIPVARVKRRLFLLSGVFSALAGVVYTMRFASSRPDGAVGFELLVIAAVLFGGVSIFGGAGTMWGVICAVLFLGALRSLLLLQKVPPNALNIITGGLLLASVVVPAVIAALPRRRKPLISKELPCEPDSLARSPQRQPSSSP